MTDLDCTTIDRGPLTWDWNNEYTVPAGDYTLVKPAGAHNNIKVIGSPEKITIFSNGGTQDRTGQEYLNGDWGSDIQWVELCWTPKTPPVVEPPVIEDPPTLNDPVFQWLNGEPTVDCEAMTITIVSHEEAAGWYWGNDGEQHLGGFFPTGNSQEKTILANAEECPAPPVTEEPEVPVEEIIETPVIETPIQTKQTTVQNVSTPPESLAVTGAGMEWATLVIGGALITTGLIAYLKKPKR